MSFVLDQLAVLNRGGNPDHERRPLPPGLRGALDLGRTGMFGQSDGGSTTAHALHADARIKAGVNLDGTLWTPQADGRLGPPAAAVRTAGPGLLRGPDLGGVPGQAARPQASS